MRKLLLPSVLVTIQCMLLTYQSLFPILAGVPTFLYHPLPCPTTLKTIYISNSHSLLEGKEGAGGQIQMMLRSQDMSQMIGPAIGVGHLGYDNTVM